MISRRGWRRRVRHTVVVALDTGQAVEGVLAGAEQDIITIRKARILAPGQEARDADGEVDIPMARVLWVQVLNGAVAWQ